MPSASQWMSQFRNNLSAHSAGTLAGSGGRLTKLRRPATVPQSSYTQTATVDVGIYGVATPVVFSAAGTATCMVGPQGVGESWALDQCYLSTSIGALDAAQCTVYAGPMAVAGLEVASNLAGGGSQFGLGGVGLYPGDYIWAVFTGGTAGATAKLRVTGARTVLTT